MLRSDSTAADLSCQPPVSHMPTPLTFGMRQLALWSISKQPITHKSTLINLSFKHQQYGWKNRRVQRNKETVNNNTRWRHHSHPHPQILIFLFHKNNKNNKQKNFFFQFDQQKQRWYFKYTDSSTQSLSSSIIIIIIIITITETNLLSIGALWSRLRRIRGKIWQIFWWKTIRFGSNRKIESES